MKMFHFQIYCHGKQDDSGRYIISEKCETTVFIETMISLSNLLVCFNSAANFLLYMLRGKKFRDAFCQTYFWILFKCRRKTSGNGESPILSSTTAANHATFGVRRPVPHPSRLNKSKESASVMIFNGPETRINVGGSRHLMAVRNESEANFTTTSFIEGDVLLTVHIADADADADADASVDATNGKNLSPRKAL